MATKRYCVFWFPSIFHQTGLEVVDKSRKIDYVDISDQTEHSSFRLFLCIEETESGNLKFCTFTLAPDGVTRNERKCYILTKENESNNGFVVYSYEDDEIDFNDYFFSSILYHHAKSLRHNHEINHDSDSGLSAMPVLSDSFSPDDIFKQDNEAIQYYLCQYEHIFAEHYAYELSRKNRVYEKILSTLERFRQYRNPEKWQNLGDNDLRLLEKAINVLIKEVNEVGKDLLGRTGVITDVHGKKQCRKAIKELLCKQGRICHFLIMNILRLCDNAAVEYTYCKTLIESKYNTQIKHNTTLSRWECSILNNPQLYDSLFEECKQRDLSRKTGNNIRNSVRYIQAIKEKYSNRTYELVDTMLTEADVLSKSSYRLTWIFGFATAISLVLAIVSLCKTC